MFFLPARRCKGPAGPSHFPDIILGGGAVASPLSSGAMFRLDSDWRGARDAVPPTQSSRACRNDRPPGSERLKIGHRTQRNGRSLAHTQLIPISPLQRRRRLLRHVRSVRRSPKVGPTARGLHTRSLGRPSSIDRVTNGHDPFANPAVAPCRPLARRGRQAVLTRTPQ